MPYMSVVLYVYAVLLLLGGIFGYAKAKSSPSLIAGIVAAILAAVAGYLVPTHHRIGDGLAIVLSLVLALFFLRRFLTTRRSMPALPMIFISAIVCVLSILALVKRLS